MIGRVAGVIVHRGADHVVIDARGVGYLVQVNDRTLAALPGVGEVAALWTELLVREDLLQLFGFPTLLEKEWHRMLVTVQGVGAKASMAILGALGAEGVGRAVALGDARAIQAAPGVGPKLAARVILELKARAPALMAMGAEPGMPATMAATGPGPAPQPPVPARAQAAASAEALSALVNLGYGQGEAAEAVARAAGEAPEEQTAGLIRRALKALAPRA
jgi:Holliday junction DNA helicase RuvA